MSISRHVFTVDREAAGADNLGSMKTHIDAAVQAISINGRIQLPSWIAYSQERAHVNYVVDVVQIDVRFKNNDHTGCLAAMFVLLLFVVLAATTTLWFDFILKVSVP